MSESAEQIVKGAAKIAHVTGWSLAEATTALKEAAGLERLLAIEEAATRVLAGAESFCSSWAYQPPEAMPDQWRWKLQGPLAELDAAVKGKGDG